MLLWLSYVSDWLLDWDVLLLWLLMDDRLWLVNWLLSKLLDLLDWLLLDVSLLLWSGLDNWNLLLGLANHLWSWALGRVLKLSWSLVLVLVLGELLLDSWREEAVSVRVD